VIITKLDFYFTQIYMCCANTDKTDLVVLKDPLISSYLGIKHYHMNPTLIEYGKH